MLDFLIQSLISNYFCKASIVFEKKKTVGFSSEVGIALGRLRNKPRDWGGRGGGGEGWFNSLLFCLGL